MRLYYIKFFGIKDSRISVSLIALKAILDLGIEIAKDGSSRIFAAYV